MGREQRPERTLGQPISSRALRTLCFFSLVDAKLPGKGFVFLLQEKMYKPQDNAADFQAEDFTTSIQTSHYLIPQ